MPPLEFTTTIEKNWIMRCAFAAPELVAELGGWQVLGAGGQGIPVLARYGGEIFDTVLVPGGAGRGRLSLRMEVLRPLRLDAGDRITITLERSSSPQEPVLAEDLRRALQNRPAARRAFDAATPATRRWVVRHLDEARQPETRQNRLEKIIEAFAERAGRAPAPRPVRQAARKTPVEKAPAKNTPRPPAISRARRVKPATPAAEPASLPPSPPAARAAKSPSRAARPVQTAPVEPPAQRPRSRSRRGG